MREDSAESESERYSMMKTVPVAVVPSLFSPFSLHSWYIIENLEEERQFLEEKEREEGNPESRISWIPLSVWAQWRYREHSLLH
jgi:hypothetical protein